MISVVVSAQSEEQLSPELITSLSQQTLPHQIVYSFHPHRPQRLQGMKQAQFDLVLFLDQDCELPSNHFLADLQQFFERTPHIDGLAGVYESAASAPRLARAYNKMCKAWVLADDGQNILGGCFALMRPQRIPPAAWDFSDWGGEDSLLGRKLRSLNFKVIPHSDFAVIHHDAGRISKFAKRAWIHGRARKGLNLKTSNRFLSGISNLEALKWDEIILIAIHVLIVEISSFASGLNTPHNSPTK